MVKQIYNVIYIMKDQYVNSTSNGTMIWCNVCSFEYDIQDVMQNQQECNHKLSSRDPILVKVVCGINVEFQNPLIYDVTNDVEYFMDIIEQEVPIEQVILALDVVL